MAVAFGLWIVAPAGPAAAQSQTVSIADFSFSPPSVQVAMGPAEPGFLAPHAHVLFVNNGAQQHNVTFSAGAQSSPDLNPNQFYDAVFLSAGTFAYHCAIHPAMQGSVTVTPLPTTTTTATTEPPPTEAPTTAPPATTAPAPTATTRPRVATTVRPATVAAATTTTTTAPTTTEPTTTPAAPETTTVPATEPASTATTAGDADVSDGLRVAAPSPSPSDSPRWSVVVLVAALGGGASLFAGRTVWRRRRASPGEH